MGAPKATLCPGGEEPLLDRIHRAIRQADLPVTLVGEGPITEGASRLDRIPDQAGIPGPLGGILAAVNHDPSASWLVFACDLALLQPAAIRWLIDQRREDHIAVLPRLSERRVEPLFAVYEPGARGLLEAIALDGPPAPRHLAGLPGVATPEPPAEIRACWTNVNTPEDVERLEL